MPKRKTSNRIYSPRKLDIREVKQRFLIVCGSAETEVNYFNSFRVPKKVVPAPGDPCRLVKKTYQFAAKDKYDQIWCVFDRDPHINSIPAKDFENALKNAKKNGFNIAYSNECFELWYILHFELLDYDLPRSNYGNKLTKYLGEKYEKNDPNMYEKSQKYQADAIRNAEKLLSSYDRPNPEQDNPATTVHLLVQALNKFIS
jgi:RloB-like protein